MGPHLHNVVDMTEVFVCGGNEALCQITFPVTMSEFNLTDR